MNLLAATGAILLSAATPAGPSPTTPLADIVRRIQTADYQGARPELQRLANLLEDAKGPGPALYQHYWRGFALWRRALNGFNEEPMPSDLEADLRAAIASFQNALVEQPGWIEARLGIWGCSGPLYVLVKDDPARRDAVLKAYVPLIRDLSGKALDNPRALWLTGQSQAGPEAKPGEAVKTFHNGIEAWLAEIRKVGPEEPVWIPHWGGPENLMNLAYVYTYTNIVNPDLALAYAQGALVAAPEWHYVRDILQARILSLRKPAGEDVKPGLQP